MELCSITCSKLPTGNQKRVYSNQARKQPAASQTAGNDLHLLDSQETDRDFCQQTTQNGQDVRKNGQLS